jgi:hypothetical protein
MSKRSDPADTHGGSILVPSAEKAGGELESAASGHPPSPVFLTLLAIAILVAVPWYWHLLGQSVAGYIIFGLPLWVWTSIIGSFVVSCFTFWLYQRPWAAEADSEQSTTENG